MLPAGKTRTLITQLNSQIKNHDLSVASLSATMSDVLGGTDANGAWTWRQAFDLMQIAAGRVVSPDIRHPQRSLAQLTQLMNRLPTETRRSERQVQLQQFSTPLDLAFVVSCAARIRKDDLVLEPSAGTGALAVMAQAQGAKLVLNELDPDRRALLQAASRQLVTDHDAEFIADLLDEDISPDVVLMNPPFASSATRSDPTIAARHVLSALKALRAGGRLVAIVPPSVSAASNPGLWRRICAQANPVLRLTLPRSAFRKMGASVQTDLLVLDKSGAWEGVDAQPVTCPDLETTLSVLQDKCPPRLQPGAPVIAAPKRAPEAAVRKSATGRKMMLPRQSSAAAHVATPLEVELLPEPRVNAPVSDVYAAYAPQRIAIKGAQAHPSPMVESVAMGSVHPPQPKGDVLSLPEKLITEGLLSEAQLETILMAESAFSTDLPGRFTRDDDDTLVRADDEPGAIAFRQGFFLGDGTGCGKGRQVAGTILAGWLAGRRKALWISKSATLIEDAVRDWCDIGGGQSDIHTISRWKPDEDITLTQGILFCTYATLRAVGQSGARRLDQILRWLGDGFDGVIAFDEAHAMQNAGGGNSDRGIKAASQQGLAGLRLQTAVPRARVLYVSATGATEVSNLAYASRLGLWGQRGEYPFPSRAAFVSAMEAGGVAAMEVVARDLKALGLYTARALSFEGVEYDILEHALSPDQVEMYDTYASAFRTIHTNLQAALEATGVTNTDGEGAAKAAGAARSAAISAFESTKQRFFNHLLQGLKAPSVIAQIRSDIDEGWAPVVQIVSTGEALLKRRLETLDPEEDLTEGALTPRDYVVGYLERAFPVIQQVLVEQEDGSILSQPLRDERGQPVISREAEALRQEALEEIMLLAPVPAALDQLIWAFGTEVIAEVTGRSQRPIKDEAGNLRIERRSASANSAETTAFMRGNKQVLIFSDAGGTGRSYHAAQTAANQNRRRHYLLEPGWRADAAIQGLGRTHRAAQVSAPFFRVCTSNVHGEKRFTSTIARRLDTLGALTKGQRETASQGLFRASDNLESPIARACLRSLYGDIVHGDCLAITYEDFQSWTGLILTTAEGVMLEELPPIQRFLNRVLALPIALQNALFAAFMDKIETATERAIAAGTLDVGLETLRGDRITAGEAQDLRRCARTGAVTRLVPLAIERKLSYRSAGTVLADDPLLSPMQNAASGKVALISPRPRQVFDADGTLALERAMIRPAKKSYLEETQFERSAWEPVDPGVFSKLWDAEVRDLPDVEIRRFQLLTGLILPIWTEIPGDNTRIYRAQPENGPALLGRALDDNQAAVLRGKFLELDVETPADILAVVQSTDRSVDLANGITLKRRRVAGRQRLELTGVAKESLPWLKSLGCFTEIHQYQLRVFLPADPEDAALKILATLQAGSVAVDTVSLAAE